MKLHENDVHVWNDEMVLVPKSGTAYIIKGHIDSINNILKADGMCWNNKSWGPLEEDPKHYFYYVAIPVVGKTREKSGEDPALNLSFSKLIMYDENSSTFLVEYVGDDSQYEWKRKHLKTDDASGIQDKSTYLSSSLIWTFSEFSSKRRRIEDESSDKPHETELPSTSVAQWLKK